MIGAADGPTQRVGNLRFSTSPESGALRVELVGAPDADPNILQRLVREAFDKPSTDRVEVRIHTRASVARQVLEDLGAIHEATLRQPVSEKRGTPGPPMIYAVHRDDLTHTAAVQDRAPLAPPTLRAATGEDVDALFELEQSAFGVGYDRGQLRQLIALFPGLTSLAFVDDRPVGYSTCGIVHDEPAKAWILSMGVRRSSQSTGIGTALLERSLADLRRREVEVVHLSVDPTRLRTIAFYQSHGFHSVGQVADYFGPGEPRSIMRRDL